MFGMAALWELGNHRITFGDFTYIILSNPHSIPER